MLTRIQAALPSVCAAAFRDDATPVDLRPLEHGVENHLFGFELQRDGAPSEALMLKLYSRGPNAAALEHRVTTGARAQGFPAIEVLHLERDPNVLGRAFTILRRIEGQTLAQAMRSADPARARELLRRFSTLLADLHRLDPQAVLGESGDAAAALDDELTRCADVMGRLEVPELTPVLEWLRARRPEVTPRGPSVIHQDYQPRNVLLDDEDRLHVIDWTIARVTDPRSDLALTLLTLAQAGFPQLGPLIENDYAAASEEPLTDMPFFHAMACLKSFAGRFSVLDDAERKRPAVWARMVRRPNWDQQLINLRKNHAPLRHTYERLRELTSIVVPEAEVLLDELRAQRDRGNPHG